MRKDFSEATYKTFLPESDEILRAPWRYRIFRHLLVIGMKLLILSALVLVPAELAGTADLVQPPYPAGPGRDAFLARRPLAPSPTPTPGNYVCRLNLEFSTYLGGSYDTEGWALAAGADGRAIVAGGTASPDFPTLNPYQAGYAGGIGDCFLSILSSSGSSLVGSTYFGGSGNDVAFDIALDSLGCIYLTGITSSPDFPTLSGIAAQPPFQTAYGGGTSDAFAAKFASSGSALSYSSYLGGNGEDSGQKLAVNASFEMFIAGSTYSADFPTVNPYQASRAAPTQDAFAGKVDGAATSLLFSTYLGGDLVSWGAGIAVAPDGGAFVAGYTRAASFPTVNAYQPSNAGEDDAYLLRLSSDGSSLLFSTYFGGSSYEFIQDFALNSAGEGYIAGWTWTTDLPVLNAYQPSFAGGSDGLLAKFSSMGSLLVFSTYLGGSSDDETLSLDLDSQGCAYLAGFSRSDDFPTRHAYQPTHTGITDATLTKFDSSGSEICFSTYLGGSGADDAFAVAVGPDGKGDIGGFTTSNDFPTANPYQPARKGSTSAFVARMSLFCYYTSPTPTATPSPSPIPTVSPSAIPIMTPTPSTTATALPSPTPTIIRCFYVSGGVIDKVTGLPVGDAAVRAVAVTEPPSPATLSDGAGYFNANPCSHFPSGTVRAEARRRDYLPAFTEATFANWNSVTGLRIELMPAYSLPGVSQGDYNGDGVSDVALFRPSATLWAIRNVTRAYFGAAGDDLVPGDFDGNGTTEIAVFRAERSLWAVRGLTRVYYGDFSDVAVPGDYDADGTTDYAVFRQSSSLWAARDVTRLYFGLTDDQPVGGEYTGSGRATIAIYRPGNALWAIRDVTRSYFGSSADRLVPGDYGGTGAWLPAIFRSTSGLWAVRSLTRVYLGITGDWGAPADYDGNGRDDYAVFRGSAMLWAIRDLTRVSFGTDGDIPATR